MITRSNRLLRRLVRVEVWLVGACVAVSVVLPQTLPFALALVALYWSLRWLADGRFSVRTPMDWAIGVLVLMALISMWITALPATTHPQVYRLLLGIGLFYSLVNWTNSDDRLRLLVVATAVIGLCFALGAFISVRWFTNKLPFVSEALYARTVLLVSDSIHPNVMAGALVVLLPISLAQLLFNWQHLSVVLRLLFGSATGCMMGTLLLTQSRGGLLALIAVGVVLVLLRWRRGWLMVGMALLGALAIYIIGVDKIVNAVISTDNVSNAASRIEAWSRGWHIIQDFPLTGVGMGSYKQVVDLMYPLRVNTAEVPHAHNMFLQVAVDLGLPGLVAWLTILSLVIGNAFVTYQYGRARPKPLLTALGAGLIASQSALIVHGLVDAVMWGMVRTASLVWAVWALAVICKFRSDTATSSSSDANLTSTE